MQDVTTTMGRTVLFVSHNMGSVQRLCDRAVLLHDGELLLNGPTREVVSGYLGLGAERLGERVWNDVSSAPGDDTARIRAVRVLDDRGELSTDFDVRDPVYVQMEYSVAPGSRVSERHVRIPQRTRRVGVRVYGRLGRRDASSAARGGTVPLHLPDSPRPAEQWPDVRARQAVGRRPRPRRAAGRSGRSTCSTRWTRRAPAAATTPTGPRPPCGRAWSGSPNARAETHSKV